MEHSDWSRSWHDAIFTALGLILTYFRDFKIIVKFNTREENIAQKI